MLPLYDDAHSIALRLADNPKGPYHSRRMRQTHTQAPTAQEVYQDRSGEEGTTDAADGANTAGEKKQRSSRTIRCSSDRKWY